jgi:hypothetical protein
LNEGEEDIEKCEKEPDCMVRNINLGDSFNFNVCTPKYPEGFGFTERYQETAESICGLASRRCVVKFKKTLSGCKCVENCACLESVFAENMNDLCRGLGDCGLESNILGEYTENYNVKESPRLGDAYIQKIVSFAKPVPGQYAKVGNMTKYLQAAGVLGFPDSEQDSEDSEESGGGGLPVGEIAMGLSGTLLAMKSLGVLTESTLMIGDTITITNPSLGAYGNALLAFAVGAIAGSMIAKSIGLNPIGSTLMAIGVGILAYTGAVHLLSMDPILGLCVDPTSCIIVAAILIIISLFFGGAKCQPVIVEFECKPWQPPVGGENCEKCNNDLLKPCSEYRCESLGAACELINKGTDEEMCIEENPNDSNPPEINPNQEVENENAKYSNIKDNGFEITNMQGGCLDAYTPLAFGINTNEPAQCKFDLEMKEFENMQFDLGGNSFIYNHTTVFMLPDPSHGISQGLNFTGDINFYIKCRDTHGNEIPGFYTVEMCVNQGEDITPPKILRISPFSDSLVSYDSDEKKTEFYTNEPAECRWSLEDKDYENMENSFECEQSTKYCSSNLPINSNENIFYIRCKDQPWLENSDKRNSMQESYEYILKKPESKINIKAISPNENFESSTKITTVNLRVQTQGGGEFPKCYYSFSGYSDMILFFRTGLGDDVHEQEFSLLSGKRYRVYIKCEDETGDWAEDKTQFKISYDFSPPQIARIFIQDGQLKIITNENADCRYSTDKDKKCNFDFNDAGQMGVLKEHSVSIKFGKTYYIKCEDEHGRIPSGCSKVIKPI